MSADIHGVVQYRWDNNDKWSTFATIEDTRSYFLFAILAGVRNYWGLPQIAPLRGLPDDFSEDEYWTKKILNGQSDFMGDHSFTWYTLEEIRDWERWDDADADGTAYRDRCETFLTWLRWIELKKPSRQVRIVIGFDS